MPGRVLYTKYLSKSKIVFKKSPYLTDWDMIESNGNDSHILISTSVQSSQAAITKTIAFNMVR